MPCLVCSPPLGHRGHCAWARFPGGDVAAADNHSASSDESGTVCRLRIRPSGGCQRRLPGVRDGDKGVGMLGKAFKVMRFGFCVASLLACFAFASLGVWNHWAWMGLFWADKGVRYEFSSGDGRVVAVVFRPWGRQEPFIVRYGPNEPPRSLPPAASRWGPLGIGWMTNSYRHVGGFEWASGIYSAPFAWQVPRASFYRVGAPCWFLSLITAIGPALWLGRLHRQRRCRGLNAIGRCATCGYDLTGTISGVCPECGTLLLNPASSASGCR
jgi:hypothetical protein